MIEINLQSYPKHRVNLYDDNGFLKETVEVDDSLNVLRELTKEDIPFDDIKLQRKLKVACELFKPTKIRIMNNEKQNSK